MSNQQFSGGSTKAWEEAIVWTKELQPLLGVGICKWFSTRVGFGFPSGLPLSPWWCLCGPEEVAHGCGGVRCSLPLRSRPRARTLSDSPSVSERRPKGRTGRSTDQSRGQVLHRGGPLQPEKGHFCQSNSQSPEGFPFPGKAGLRPGERR